MDYFDDLVADGAVIYVGNILFWYSEKEGTCTEVVENQTGNVFLAESRDHKFLLKYRNTLLHTFAESRRSSHNYIKILVPSQPICDYCFLIPMTHCI